MAREARASANAYAVVLDDAVNDRGLAMTSSFTNMVVFGQALAHLWSESEEDGPEDEYEATLNSMSAAAEYLLEDGASLAYALAADSIRRACFIGAGGLAATARESALKLLELTDGTVQTLFETPLGLRHGPMSSLNNETLFTCFLSNDKRRRQYEVDLIRQIKRKQSAKTIVGIAAGKADCDHVLYTPAFDKIDDAYRPAVDVIFGQMLGLFASIELGLTPDAPSPSGLISRVVENFTIYV
jgi:tagatose-6-phosphate ketose/aldose isomerase